MPPPTNETPLERKRAGAFLPKKRKKVKSEESELERLGLNTENSIERWEEQILASRQHYTNIRYLFEGAESDSVEALYALCRVFCHLLASGELSKSIQSTENDLVIAQWLFQNLGSLWKLIRKRLPTLDSHEQQHCLRLAMQLLREESLAKTESLTETSELRLTDLFDALAHSLAEEPLDSFLAQYICKHLDLGYAIAQFFQEEIGPGAPQQYLDFAVPVLKALGGARPQGSWMFTNSGETSKKDGARVTQKQLTKSIGKAWLAVVAAEMDKRSRKMVLKLVPETIAPLLRKPEKLLDFLVDSINQGGSTALLALSGLFYLIQEENLDYPQFYRKVYSMLDGSILHSKHRSNFLRLLDTFLASSHLPAVLVASFLKRLARLCLFAPPAAIAFVVPLTYNLLKTHPVCTFMIHRVHEGAEDDPFDMNEGDPTETGALESSLWELHTLQSHYHPNVSIISRIISEQFTKPAYNLEDFLDHSYASMLESDLTKTIKKEPVVEYQIPKVIFPRQKRDLTSTDDPLDLWGFDA